MKKISKYSVVCAACMWLLFFKAYAQNSSHGGTGWLLGVQFAADKNFTAHQTGQPTDALINVSQPLSLQLSTSLFFQNNFGITIAFAVATPQRYKVIKSDFEPKVISEFGESYYLNVELDPNEEFGYEPILGGNLRTLAGLSYRIHTHKLIIVPQLLLGNTRLIPHTAMVFLKEKNSNNRYKVSYFDTQLKAINTITVSPGISLLYKIHGRFLLNADLRYVRYRPSFSYTREFTDLYSEGRSKTVVDYSRTYQILSGGIGLMYEIL